MSERRVSACAKRDTVGKPETCFLSACDASPVVERHGGRSGRGLTCHHASQEIASRAATRSPKSGFANHIKQRDDSYVALRRAEVKVVALWPGQSARPPLRSCSNA